MVAPDRLADVEILLAAVAFVEDLVTAIERLWEQDPAKRDVYRTTSLG